MGTKIDKPFEVDVSSKYGAPYGRRSTPAAELSGKVHLQRVPFYDGDYDKGGAYWGGGDKTPPLFCAWNDDGACYLRAKNRDDARAQLLAENPQLDVQPLEEDATAFAASILDTVVDSYIVAALWSTQDDEGPLDDRYTSDDVADATRAAAVEDCRDFIERNAADVREAFEARGVGASQIGHDFWLTRNRHGVGFDDRDLGELGKRLANAARACNEIDCYVGDDGKIYIE